MAGRGGLVERCRAMRQGVGDGGGRGVLGGGLVVLGLGAWWGVGLGVGLAGLALVGGCASYTTQSGAFAHETVRVTAEAPVASEGSGVAGVRLAAESR